ncbi:MAG: hypothetical protein ACI3W5_06135 [Faecousia sp.]
MGSRKGKIPRILCWAAIAFSAIALCLTSMGRSSAKYASQSSGGAGTSVAQFSPSFVSEYIDITAIQKPGDTVVKPFSVRNYTGSTVTEVTPKYQIVVKTTGNLPLRFSILNSVGQTVKTFSCSGTDGKQTYEYAADTLVFGPGEQLSHGYQLRVEWPAGQKDAQFADMTDAVYVSVVWEQVD